MDKEDIEIAMEIQENKKSDKQKLKEALERIDDLEYRVQELFDTLESHKHDVDGFPTKNF